MKANKANKKTTSISQKEYFPCPDCKKPLTTASALTRHVKTGNCTPSTTFNQGIVVKCPLCPKICQSTGGLVRHTKSAHADVTLVSNTLPLGPKAKAAAARKKQEESSATSGAKAAPAGTKASSAGSKAGSKASSGAKAAATSAGENPDERLSRLRRVRAVEKVILDVQ